MRTLYEIKHADVYLIQGFICGLGARIKGVAGTEEIFKSICDLEEMYSKALEIESQLSVYRLVEKAPLP